MNTQRVTHPGHALAATALAIVLAGCAGQASRPTADTAKPPGPRDEMRVPWTALSEGFLRSWLVLGEFPNPPHDGAKAYDHTPPCVGLDTDYLKEQGGEAAVRPVAGMKVRRPDGSTAAWTAIASKEDEVGFAKCLAGRPTENVVAYAYTTITSPQERPAVLAVGSDDGVRLWLNGKVVHEILASRSVGVRRGEGGARLAGPHQETPCAARHHPRRTGHARWRVDQCGWVLGVREGQARRPQQGGPGSPAETG